MGRMTGLLVLGLLFVQSAFAEVAPGGVVREALTRMKATKDLQVVLDYVHWETAFREMSSRDRVELKVRNPVELRERYRKLIADPASVVRARMERQIGEPKSGIFDSVTGTVSQGFAVTVREFKRRVVYAEYKIGKATVNGSDALVPVTVISQGEVERRNVPLRNIQGRWYLPSFQALDKNGFLRDALSGNLLGPLQLPM